LYVEDLLALNFLVNSFLLVLASRLTARKVGWARLLSGGILASLYSLALFLPVGRWVLSPAAKVLASLIIVAYTFRPHRVVDLLRLCGVFFLCSFFLGGAVFALHLSGTAAVTVSGGVYYLRAPRPGTLLLGVIIVFCIAAGVWRFLDKKSAQRQLYRRLLIRGRQGEATVPALVDTGNNLHDPFSGRPLCIVSFRPLLDFLPGALREAYLTGKDPVEALGLLENTGDFGVVPFRSLQEGGMLVTYRTAAIWLVDGNRRRLLRETVIAITAGALSEDGGVEALINPRVLDPD
jgi:stage II sporulation protein GA (sporulation sigma-E factor processing peptidase)